MADGINKVILVGNLGKDPEVSYTQGGTARCRFPLATGETYLSKTGERQDRTEWHNVVVWGKQGENVGKYLAKGRQVYIEGSLRTRSWDDEKTGQKKYMTEVNAQKVVFLGGRGEGGPTGGMSTGGGGGYSGPADSGMGGGGMGGGYDGPPSFGDDDDIPF
ncbi:MAG: single-stranded DNA-binding protein [Deltaproteobacteria bacterium]|nr:single-stranded DNA-binding protein [Deltaproteobacteria bacterium]